MRKMRWLAMLLALVMIAAACGSDDDSTDAGDSGDGGDTAEETTTTEQVDVSQGGDLTFYMITHSDEGPFWSVVKRGMEAACDDVGVLVRHRHVGRVPRTKLLARDDDRDVHHLLRLCVQLGLERRLLGTARSVVQDRLIRG